MKKLGALLPLAVAAGCLAAIAIASGPAIPSTVSVDTGNTITDPVSPDRDFAIAGHVESPKVKCLANRRVKLRGFYGISTTPRPFDTARSGRNGGFNGVGPSTHGGNTNTIAGAKVVLKPKRIGTKKHPKKCGGDSSLAG